MSFYPHLLIKALAIYDKEFKLCLSFDQHAFCNIPLYIGLSKIKYSQS